MPDDAQQETTTGAAPFAAVRPSIEVEGKTYRLQRMGWDDCWTIVSIIGSVLRQGGADSAQVTREAHDGSFGMTAIGGLFAAAAQRNDALLRFAAGTLRRVDADGAEHKVEPGDLRDGEKFPAYFVPRWLGAIAKHPDWVAFFAELETVGPSLIEVGLGLSSRLRSTASSDKPDGPTSG